MFDPFSRSGSKIFTHIDAGKLMIDLHTFTFCSVILIVEHPLFRFQNRLNRSVVQLWMALGYYFPSH